MFITSEGSVVAVYDAVFEDEIPEESEIQDEFEDFVEEHNGQLGNIKLSNIEHAGHSVFLPSF